MTLSDTMLYYSASLSVLSVLNFVVEVTVIFLLARKLVSKKQQEITGEQQYS